MAGTVPAMMTLKNWICGVLLIWAVVATLLYLRRQEFNATKTMLKTEQSKEVVPVMDPHLAHYFSKIFHKQATNEKEQSKEVVSVMDPHLAHYFSNIFHKQAANEKEQSKEVVPVMDPHLTHYFSKIFHKQATNEKEEFTIIIMTYKREKVLPKLLLHYCKTKNLHKILVIWNDVGSFIPQNILSLSNECQVTLQFIQESENKVTNRFKPRPEIETECKWD